jgi:hypothetical protein
MILSHRYRFIFVKTRKTAGTSVEIALAKHCGPEDIITRITASDEAVRQALGHRGPQNFSISRWRWTPGDWVNAVRRQRHGRFYNHMSAAEIRARVGPRVWDSYYKIALERNPWDLVVSAYFWHHRKEPRPPIGEFIRSPEVRSYSNLPLYTIDGRIAVDHVGRYEDLPAELERFAARVGLPEVPSLPRAKGEFRSDRRHYSEILGPEERDQIARLFAAEIEAFGYTFAPAPR